MNARIQELTDRIYLEGVEKGNAEAARIVADARTQADSIVADARAQADSIVANARTEADALKTNTQAELQLYARQAVDALKSQITDLIAGTVASDSVKAATADKDFMQRMLLTFVQSWAENDRLTIQAADAEALTRYFEANAKQLLDQGVTIRQAAGTKTDFAIVSENKGYKITFGQEELKAYFNDFLRPKLVEMLFGR